MNWTDERTELLKKLWDDGLWVSRIAAQLGVSRGSITGKVHRLKLPPRKHGSNGSYKWGQKNDGAERKPIPPKMKKPGRLTGIIATTGHGGHKGRPGTIQKWNPPPLTEDQKDLITGQGIPLIDTAMAIVGQGKQAALRWSGGLQVGQCKWVINDQERGGKYLFCGILTFGCGPYCEAHARRAGSGYGRAA